MNKVAHYLQEHLVGEVMTSDDARRYFSTDSSIFKLTPAIIAYPRNENDVRKTARFTWQLAERGRSIPITARGAGTDQAGASLGLGVMLVFPAHMNKILELDTKSGSVVVEPGLNFSKLQQTLHTHGRFLPPYPASAEYSTLGGAVANNAGGEKSIKYGTMRNYVDGLRVVLANGEIIDTKRLSKRELSKKMGLATFEGEVYRALDTLIEENHDLVEATQLGVTKNASGYNIAAVKEKNGSFDLTPLFVGSQGTLGIITEITLATEQYNPSSTVLAAFCNDIDTVDFIVREMRGLSKPPSAIELVDENLLQFVGQHNPNQLRGILNQPYPSFVIIIEFDDVSSKDQKRMAKKAARILEKHHVPFKMETEESKKEELWKIRHSVASVLSYSDGKNGKALPIIDDGIVPVEHLGEFMDQVYALFESYKLPIKLWGHVGNANLHVQPLLDLNQVGDRQKVFKIIDDYYKLVISLGGSISAERNDGRLRAPYLEMQYGPEIYELFRRVKGIFDPHGILNEGVKIDVSLDDIKPLLRTEFSLDHLYNHMPRT
jgi:FAD/FMN-containing dehydrogenase